MVILPDVGSIHEPSFWSTMFCAAQWLACFAVLNPVLVRRLPVGSVYWMRYLIPLADLYFCGDGMATAARGR